MKKKSHLLPAIAIAVTLLLLVTGFTHQPVSAQVGGRQDFRAPTKWEYKVVVTQFYVTNIKDNEAKYNELGEDGWELGGTISYEDNLAAVVFKRPKR